MAASQRRTQKPVSDFISLYDNQKTKYNYLLAVTIYLRFIYDDQTLTTQNKKQLDTYAKQYLKTIKKERDLFHDLKLAANTYVTIYAPKTALLNLTIVILWLEDNGNILSRRDRKRIFAGLPAPQAITKDPELTAELFTEIEKYLPPWAQTLLKVLIGTGLRLGEALALEKSDLDETGRRTTAVIRAENAKTKTERTVVFTTEAANALSNYLTTRTGKSKKIFPYSLGHAQYVLRKAKAKAIEESSDSREKKNISLFHWHTTRKWFLSKFSLNASKSIGELLAGHTGYLDNAYRRYSQDTITDEFIKAEPFIQISGEVNG